MRDQVETAARRLPVRSVDITRLLDTLLVCAVLTILVVRTQLYLTNYPQLGGHGLHIAHLLWGGMLMLIALGMLLAFVGTAARQVAAVIGGVGLGLFIDELGKFVTADNNYFFKPTAAIIYCFFVVLFLAVRQLDRRRRFSQREYLVNAIELAKEAATHDMNADEQRRALALLDRADQSDPIVPALRRMLTDVPSRPAPAPTAAVRAARGVQTALHELVEQPWFPTLVTTFFAVWTLASVLQIIGLILFASTGLPSAPVFRLGRDITSNPLGSGEVDFIQWLDLASSIIATSFMLVGLYRIWCGRRAGAFAMFERGLLVSIFFTQVFAFIHSQFAAVFGFLVDLLLFVVVRTALSQDLEQQATGFAESAARLQRPLTEATSHAVPPQG